MDMALTNALKRKKELERELDRVNQFIELYGEFARGAAVLNEHVMRAEHASNAEMNGSDSRRKSKVRGRPDDFADFMESILREVRRPLPRGPFVEEVEKRGRVIPSDDKARYLGTILWRQSDRFESVDGGYWLKGVPLPTTEGDLLG